MATLTDPRRLDVAVAEYWRRAAVRRAGLPLRIRHDRARVAQTVAAALAVASWHDDCRPR